MITLAKSAVVGVAFLAALEVGTARQPLQIEEGLGEISLFDCDIDIREGPAVTAETDVYWQELQFPGQLGVELKFDVPAGVSLEVGSTDAQESIELTAGFLNTVLVEYERDALGERIKVTVKTTNDAADDQEFDDEITEGEFAIYGMTETPYLTEARPPANNIERAYLWIEMYGIKYALTLTG